MTSSHLDTVQMVRFPERLARLNRVFTNPVMMRLAMRAPWLGVVHHVGRKSQRPYRSPVLVGVRRDAVVIPLMYGLERDWVRNLKQAGEFTLTFRGRDLACVDPVIVTDPATLPYTGPFWTGLQRRIEIEGYLVATRPPRA